VVILFAGYLALSLFQIFTLKTKLSGYEAREVEYHARQEENRKILTQAQRTIRNKITTAQPAFLEITLETMRYVFSNSVHSADTPQSNHAFNTLEVLKTMQLSADGMISEKPHLTCGPRAYAMRAILLQFNIYSRLVQVFSDDFETPQSHRFLEVFNHEKNRWEVWDPDYGIRYVNKTSKEPVDILPLVFGDKNDIEPVGFSTRGWDETNTARLRDHYFESVLFEQDSDRPNVGMINSRILVNRSLFDIEKVVESGITFREWAGDHYKHPKFILISPSAIAGDVKD
jgi:hypothetical protein